MSAAPPPKHTVHLTGVQQTLLITLCARARDYKLPRPILNDPWADHVLDQIEGGPELWADYGLRADFIALRSLNLDIWTRNFLERHKDHGATVISLACGLDSRSLRMDWGGNVRWVDVDLPDVVALRERLLPRPEGDYRLIGASATDDAWLKEIPADRPTFIVMEGLSMYLTKEDGNSLLERLSTRFPSGEIVLDALKPIAITFQGIIMDIASTGAKMTWSIGRPKDVEAEHPRLKVLDVMPFSSQEGVRGASYFAQIFMTVVDYFPFVWGVGHLLRFGF